MPAVAKKVAATQAAAKSAKPPTRPIAKTAVKAKSPVTTRPAPKPAVPMAADKATKPKKPKMVRDSFTFPKAEYAVLEVLKLRAAKLATPVKKTELLRAGVKAIAAMSDAAFVAAVQAVPSLKTGRPAKPKVR